MFSIFQNFLNTKLVGPNVRMGMGWKASIHGTDKDPFRPSH